MKTKTAYIASAIDNKPAVDSLMSFMRETYGVYWYNGFAWTKCDFPNSDPQAPAIVQKDIDGALHCDLFIFLLCTEHRTKGGWAEFGVRLGSGKTSHVILNGTPDHLFYYHNSVIKYSNTNDFKDAFLNGVV